MLALTSPIRAEICCLNNSNFCIVCKYGCKSGNDCSFETSYSMTHYYASENNGKFFLIEFEINKVDKAHRTSIVSIIDIGNGNFASVAVSDKQIKIWSIQ